MEMLEAEVLNFTLKSSKLACTVCEPILTSLCPFQTICSLKPGPLEMSPQEMSPQQMTNRCKPGGKAQDSQPTLLVALETCRPERRLVTRGNLAESF